MAKPEYVIPISFLAPKLAHLKPATATTFEHTYVDLYGNFNIYHVPLPMTACPTPDPSLPVYVNTSDHNLRIGLDFFDYITPHAKDH